MCFILTAAIIGLGDHSWISSPVMGLAQTRPVAGGGAGGAQAPPEIFRLESLLQKWNFSTKMDSCQWNLKFQSIVDHSKIMYCCSSVQFGIV